MRDIKFSVMGRMSSDNFPSRLHGDSVLEMVFNALKDVRVNLQKLIHLCKPLSANSPYLEDFKAKDVPSNALPSKSVVEEGEAEIRVTDAVMDIFAKTNFTVITFEDFWIGSNAKVSVHLPSDTAEISLYQQSGRPSFIFGKLTHQKGFLNLYTPYKSLRRGSFTFERMRESCGVVYQPKKDRRYLLDLADFRAPLKDERFDRYNRPGKEETNPQVNFMATVDGEFELRFIEFQKKEKEDGSYSEDDLRAFLPVCEEYQGKRVSFATETAGALQNNIANALYLKSQTLPLEEQGALLKESGEFFEKASHSGHRNADSQLVELKKLYAQWLYKMGEKKSTENFDQAPFYFQQAISVIEPLSKSDVGIIRNNFGCALIEQVKKMMNNSSSDFAQAEKFLEEADELFKKAERDHPSASENQKDVPWLRNILGVKLVEKAKPLMQNTSRDSEVLSILDKAEGLFRKAAPDNSSATENLTRFSTVRSMLQQRARGLN